MDAFPVEIIENVYFYTPIPTLYSCTLVCKLWNAIFTPLLYRTVLIDSNKTAELVERTVNASHSRVNTYIQHINFVNTSVWLHSCYIPESYMRTMPLLCNVKTVLCHHYGGVYTSEISQATQEKILNRPITHMSEVEHLKYLSCHLNSNSGLSIILQHEKAIHPDGVVGYLKLISDLIWLNIYFKEKPASPEKTIMKILRYSSSLKQLTCGTELNLDSLFACNPPVYPNIELLDICISRLTSFHIERFKSTFTYIFRLLLTVTLCDEVPLSEFINAFDYLRFCLYMPNLTQEEMKRLIKQSPRTLLVAIMYSPDVDDNAPALSLVYDILGFDDFDYTFQVNGNLFPNLSLSYLFGDAHDHVVKLTIKNSPTPVDLDEINAVFPSISELEIHSEWVINSAHVTQTNASLSTLSLYLDLGDLSQESIDVLQRMYPNINTLIFYYQNQISVLSGFKERVRTLKLWPELLCFRFFRQNNTLSPELRNFEVLVKQKVMDRYYLYSVYGWHPVENLNDLTLNDYIQRLQQPLILFEVGEVDF